MRKIEAEMCNAILSNKNFKKGNTEVEVNGNQTNVYLHGHRIATFTRNNPGNSTMEFGLCGWDSQTTKSRVKAVLNVIYHNSASIIKYDIKTKNSDVILEAINCLSGEKSCAIIDSHTRVHFDTSKGHILKLTNAYNEPVKCHKLGKTKGNEGIFAKFMQTFIYLNDKIAFR